MHLKNNIDFQDFITRFESNDNKMFGCSKFRACFHNAIKGFFSYKWACEMEERSPDHPKMTVSPIPCGVIAIKYIVCSTHSGVYVLEIYLCTKVLAHITPNVIN